ncbi:MSCRAMM family protein [Fundicoccus ignavus]|uniref:SpaA-like prealbumin fold domain-containing protein n=1 Tax=Fundicoccus ignavus TaxID=2664442 RepID=A0A844C1U0_9LACT|nr:SpaA isopeptide-forming pilin-related protein [Fundicoccus ignavus]MRJ48338.1 hypothetical protein [Fundicoccus ignavus]
MINDSYTLASAEFGVFQGTKQVGTIITDADGKGVLGNLDLGSYILRELKAPNGFTPSTQEFLINLVSTNNTQEVFSQLITIENEEQLGTIKVVKKDEETGQTLANAEFNVLDNAGNIVDTIITNANGEAVSKTLPLGKYTLVEVKAPSGYQLDKTPSAFELLYGAQTQAIY